jgi:hypothetical protein
MSIAVNAKDEVFVLGRDQITRLEDSDGDGFFDHYHCASDAFLQTLHTRDFATSLGLLPDGSFVIGRSGLVDANKHPFNETAAGRGSILRISRDGTMVSTLADGLRVPYIGVRSDGANLTARWQRQLANGGGDVAVQFDDDPATATPTFLAPMKPRVVSTPRMRPFSIRMPVTSHCWIRSTPRRSAPRA